jgi:acyl carrier protein
VGERSADLAAAVNAVVGRTHDDDIVSKGVLVMSGTRAGDLEDAVTRVISEYVPEAAGELSPNVFLDEVGVDSMTLVDIVLELQEGYSVEFPDDALAGIHTLQDMVDVLHGLVTARLSAVDAG